MQSGDGGDGGAGGGVPRRSSSGRMMTGCRVPFETATWIVTYSRTVAARWAYVMVTPFLVSV
jgi:hypothetical protein